MEEFGDTTITKTRSLGLSGIKELETVVIAGAIKTNSSNIGCTFFEIDL